MPNEVEAVESKEVEAKQEHEAILNQAKQLAAAIKDDLTFQEAGRFLVKIKTARNKWEKEMEEPVRAAFVAHRILTEKVKKIALPLTEAEKILSPAMAKYDWEQREKLRIERERLEREAREKQEKAKLNLALELEESGRTDEAEEVLDIPTIATPAKTPDPVKSDGISFQDYWSFEVTNLAELVKAVATGTVPLMAIMANEKFLGQQARSLKEQFKDKFPGVRLLHERISKVKGQSTHGGI